MRCFVFVNQKEQRFNSTENKLPSIKANSIGPFSSKSENERRHLTMRSISAYGKLCGPLNKLLFET